MTTYNIGIVTDGYSNIVNTEDGPHETWVEIFYIGASAANGLNFAYRDVAFATHEEAEAFLPAILSDPETAPYEWVQDRTTYGSEAWGFEDDAELARFEADRYNEPAPEWAR